MGLPGVFEGACFFSGRFMFRKILVAAAALALRPPPQTMAENPAASSAEREAGVHDDEKGALA